MASVPKAKKVNKSKTYIFAVITDWHYIKIFIIHFSFISLSSHTLKHLAPIDKPRTTQDTVYIFH